MTDVEKLEARVKELSPDQLAEFREWFLEFDAAAWDRQFEADVKAGKFPGARGKGQQIRSLTTPTSQLTVYTLCGTLIYGLRVG